MFGDSCLLNKSVLEQLNIRGSVGVRQLVRACCHVAHAVFVRGCWAMSMSTRLGGHERRLRAAPPVA